MSSKQKPLLRNIAIILLCATLTACSTRQTPRTVSDHCLLDEALPYTLVPKAEREAAVAEGRPVRDDGNLADSDATRAAIGAHNRAFRSVCETKNSPAIRPGQ